MTKAVLEAESEGVARTTIAARSSPVLAVPASLHASLMARLDRLGSGQRGSADRSGDWARILPPSSGCGGAQAGGGTSIGARPSRCGWFALSAGRAAACDAICSSTRSCRTRPTARYLREPRRALHARIADTLESQFTEIAESQPELLARHCTEAGLIEKAAGLWGKAGQRSLERSALVEAMSSAYACPRSDCNLARHARAASRGDQASGRAHNPTHPC